MSRRVLFCGILIATGLGGTASAASCDLVAPFHYEYQNDVAASLLPSTDGSGHCALSVSTSPTSRSVAAGVIHYRRPSPLKTVRYGFRLDMSALGSGTAAHTIQVFSAASPIVAALPLPQSNILSILLTDGTTPSLRFVAASDGVPVQKIQSLSQPVNVIRVEISVGAGSSGKVSYWINHNFSDTPDGVIEKSTGMGLNNVAFLGVIGAAVGLSSPSASFRASHAGEAIVVDQLESDDDILFYDDFSSGAQ